MKALVYAAGLGTRLKPITDTMPKALVSVEGQTLLERTVRTLAHAGVNGIVVNTHHFSDQVKEFVHTHTFPGVELQISDETSMLLDTGGGMKHARPLLEGGGRFLVHNVDILSTLDIPAFTASAPADALAVLAVSGRTSRRRLLAAPDGRLVGWHDTVSGQVKSPFAGLDPRECRSYAFCGIHLVSEAVFPLMEKWPERFPIMDFYLDAAAEHPIYCALQDGVEVLDVGKLDALPQASDFVLRHQSGF